MAHFSLRRRSQRQVIQRGNAHAGIVEALGQGEAALQVSDRLVVAPFRAGEHAQHVMRLRLREWIARGIGQRQRLLGVMLRLLALTKVTRDQAPVGIGAGAL